MFIIQRYSLVFQEEIQNISYATKKKGNMPLGLGIRNFHGNNWYGTLNYVLT